MATIQSSLEFQDKMSAAIKSVSNALEMASIDAKFAKMELDDLEKQQSEWKKTLDTATSSSVKNHKEINTIIDKYHAATNAVDKARLSYLKYEQQVINNTSKLQQLQQRQEEFNKNLQENGKHLENNTQQLTIFGVAVGSVIGNLATRAFDALKSSISSSIELASDLIEVQNVVDVTFGQSNEVINEWSKNTLNQFGLNELSAKKFASTMGAMLKSAGITGDSLVTMSTKIAELSGDMASFYNLKPEEAFNKMRAGISGETEPLKQLGINMSVANLQAFALSQGIKTKYNNMSQAAQMTLRYQYLLQAASDAQGDFARTSSSFANQQKLVQENFKNLSATIATLFIPALTSGYTLMNKVISFFADNMTTIIPIALAAMGVITAGYIAMKAEAIQSAIASAAAWVTAFAPLLIGVGIITAVSVAFNAMGLSFREQAENIVISFYWIIGAIQNVGIAIQNTWTFVKNATIIYINANKLLFLNFFDFVLNKISILAKAIDLVFKTNVSGALNNLSNASDKLQSGLKQSIKSRMTDGFDYKAFKDNDYWTNQAKAQKLLSGSPSSLGKAININSAIDPDLLTGTTGGKALKTKNQGKIEIKEEDIKLLHDLATRDYMVNYQQLTPQVTIPGMVIHETADIDAVVDNLVNGIADVAEAKLQVSA